MTKEMFISFSLYLRQKDDTDTFVKIALSTLPMPLMILNQFSLQLALSD